MHNHDWAQFLLIIHPDNIIMPDAPAKLRATMGLFKRGVMKIPSLLFISLLVLAKRCLRYTNIAQSRKRIADITPFNQYLYPTVPMDKPSC